MIFKKWFLHPVNLLIIIAFAIGTLNCKPEEEILDFDYANGLAFSADTILFDTVFTGVGSVTKRLQVFNPNQKAVEISSIKLGKEGTSAYRILVNGTEPLESEKLLLIGKDSVLILVEVFIDPQNQSNPFLVNDSIIFETNGKKQDVKLIAWGQDANYIGNEILLCNTTWTNEKPYVIYGSILIDTLCQLTIEKGTRIFASKDANIFAKGNIIAQGTADERIVFRNERLEPAYENLHGQWGGIWLIPGSNGNLMDFCIIRNAEYGIRLGAPDNDTIPDIVLKNTIIENMSNAGILAFTSDIYAENVLVNNSIEINVGNLAGGNYTYRHCTFANYAFNIIRQTPSFYVSDNYILADNSVIVNAVNVQIQNSIIDGILEEELLFDLSGGANSQFAFTNSMFRTMLEGLDTLGNIINEDPNFIEPVAYNYRLDTLSPAQDNGINIGIDMDLDGNARDLFPDLGAYERID